MPQVSQDGQGNYFLSDDGKAWRPAPLSQDKDGNKFYNDGSAWQPLGGAAAGGDARPAAAAPRSSPSQPAAAPSPLGAMASDANTAAGEGIRTTAHGVEHLFGSGGVDPLSPESLVGRLQGAAEIPLGEMNWMMSPLAPLFTGTQEANQKGVGDPVEKATGSKWLGHAAANTLTGVESLALGPPTRGAPMRSLPYEAHPGGPPTARPMNGDIFSSGPSPNLNPPSLDLAPSEYSETPSASSFHDRSATYANGANDGGRPRNFVPDPLAAVNGMPQRSRDAGYGAPEAANDPPTALGSAADRRAAGASYQEPESSYDGPDIKWQARDTLRMADEALQQRDVALAQGNTDRARMWADHIDRHYNALSDMLPEIDDPDLLNEIKTRIIGHLPFESPNLFDPNSYRAANDHPLAFPPNRTGSGVFEDMPTPTSDTPEAANQNLPAPSRQFAVDGTKFKPIDEDTTSARPADSAPAITGPNQFNAGIDPVRAFRQIFAPETQSNDARQAHGDIREQIGLGERDTAVVQDMLEAHQRRANMMTPQERYDFFRYMQNRSKGFPINDPTLQGMADVARNAFTDVENKMRALPSTSQMAFRDDYFPQMWKDPRAAQQFFGGTRQGSGGFTKGRTFDTIDEGTAAGLELKNDNPVEMVLDYVNNANRFIALNAVRDDAVQHGYIRYIQDPRRVPPEWVKINGRLGQKGTVGGMIQGYAPRDYAQIWNNFVSQGIHGEPWKNVYDAALHAKNSVQALEFGLSAYHFFTVAMKAPALELARAANALIAGHPLTAVKAAANAVVAPVSLVRTGMKARDVALGRITGTPIERQVVDNLTRGNHRWVGLDKGGEYDYSPMRNYWTSWKRGALKGEVMHDLKGVADSWGLKAPQMILRHVGRMFQTAAGPLFEKYIPLLKNGAAYKQMHTWMESHPQASRADILRASREIGDQIDNMMGEMVHDNVMWPKIQKQLAQLSLTSFSWTFGNARWLAGGMADVGKIFSRGEMPLRAATLITYPIVLGTIAAIAQKLMTGSFPDGSDPRDFLTPRTGGTTTYGSGRHTKIVPERLMIPGSHKDVMGYYHNFGEELWNKAARFLHMGAELATNKDWQGHNITTPGQDWTNPQWLKDYFDHVFQELQPISVQQAGSGKPGSAISPTMRMLGFREPGRWLQDPEGAAQTQRYFDMKHEPSDRVQRLPHGRLRVLSPSEQDTRRQYKGPVE